VSASLDRRLKAHSQEKNDILERTLLSTGLPERPKHFTWTRYRPSIYVLLNIRNQLLKRPITYRVTLSTLADLVQPLSNDPVSEEFFGPGTTAMLMEADAAPVNPYGRVELVIYEAGSGHAADLKLADVLLEIIEARHQ